MEAKRALRLVAPESPPDDLPKSMGGGGGPGGGGAGAPPLGAPPEAEATGPCKTKMLKYFGNSFIEACGTNRTHKNVTHSLAPAQSSRVVLLDVGLQLSPNGHIGIDPFHMHLISKNKTIRQMGK